MTQHALATLTVRDFKRVSLVKIEPKRAGVTVLRGKNRAGKSSTLDGFETLLRGKAVSCPMPVRAGAERAELEAQFVDRATGKPTINVRRRFSAGGGMTLKISSADPNQPQTQGWLDQFYGNFTVDPSAILRMSSKQLAEKLREAQGIDTSALDAARQDTFEERTIVGREVTRLEGVIAQAPFPAGADEPVDVGALLRELEAAEDSQTEFEDAERALADVIRGKDAAEAEIAEAEKRLAMLKAQYAILDDQVRGLAQAVQNTKSALIDPAPIKEQIADADATNTAVRLRAAYKETSRALDAKRAEHDQLTKDIAGIDAEKERMLKESRFPFPGVSVQGDMVMLNHVPIEQASGVERAEFIAALAISQAPDMPVLLIREGLVFDEDELEVFARVAEAHGIQALMEKAGKNAEPGELLIEDGMLVDQEADGDLTPHA